VYGDFGHDDRNGSGADRGAAGSWPGNQDVARLRVSDADRDHAAAELGEHFQAGRLTQEEFSERVGKAINARTRGDLDELLADLPSDRPAGSLPASGPAGPPARQLRWAGPTAMLAAAVLLFAVAAASPHSHGRWAPWWVIPLAFIAIRRLTWRGGRPPGRWR
jgi:hypothetical protein